MPQVGLSEPQLTGGRIGPLGNVFCEDKDRLVGAAAVQERLAEARGGHFRVDLDGMGHLQDNVDLFDKTTSYEAAPVLLRNTGTGKFVDVSASAGDGMKVRAVARGVAFDDLDDDGRIDVVILSSRHPAIVLRNESETGNHWLQIQLRGAKTNRDVVGARVKVTSGDLTQIGEVHSGRGYQSHFGSRLHFGLGKRGRVDRIEVRWPGGGTEAFESPGVDRLVTLVEGQGAK